MPAQLQQVPPPSPPAKIMIISVCDKTRNHGNGAQTIKLKINFKAFRLERQQLQLPVSLQVEKSVWSKVHVTFADDAAEEEICHIAIHDRMAYKWPVPYLPGLVEVLSVTQANGWRKQGQNDRTGDVQIGKQNHYDTTSIRPWGKIPRTVKNEWHNSLYPDLTCMPLVEQLRALWQQAISWKAARHNVTNKKYKKNQEKYAN